MKPKETMPIELLDIVDQAAYDSDRWTSPSFGLAFQMRRACRKSEQRGDDVFLDAVGLLIDKLGEK